MSGNPQKKTSTSVATSKLTVQEIFSHQTAEAQPATLPGSGTDCSLPPANGVGGVDSHSSSKISSKEIPNGRQTLARQKLDSARPEHSSFTSLSRCLPARQAVVVLGIFWESFQEAPGFTCRGTCSDGGKFDIPREKKRLRHVLC